MDFFRAVIASKEISRRVLSLTKRVITLNAANYTAWHLRRTCLYQLGMNLQDELTYTAQCAENNPKNYQIWYHRKALVEKIGDGSKEPQFVSQIMSETDSKNYHAWAHRQWAIQAFNLWEGELEYSDHLIRQDVRNNSAWNHRWFVLNRGGKLPCIDDATAKREIAYAQNQAELAISNECPFNYLRAVGAKSNIKISSDPIFEWLKSKLATTTVTAVALRSLMIDALAERNDVQVALSMCMELANQYDTIRKDYWRWRGDVLAEKAN